MGDQSGGAPPIAPPKGADGVTAMQSNTGAGTAQQAGANTLAVTSAEISTGAGIAQHAGTGAGLSQQVRSMPNKKRKRNQLSPLNRSLEEEETTDRRKLSTTIKKIMLAINNLDSEISEKTKREIRNFSAELKLLSDLVEEEQMLECLNEEAEEEGEGEQMDTEEMGSVKEDGDNICVRCKREIEEDKNVAEEIKQAVVTAHDEDSEEITENTRKLVRRKWPEAAYQKTSVKVGNPLTDAEDADLLLILKTPADTSFITKKFMEKYPGLESILKESVWEGQVQYLESSTKTKKGLQSCTRVYVTAGTSEEIHFKALRELDLLLVGSQKKKLAFVAPDSTLRAQVRKLAEVVMLQSQPIVDVYVPKKESGGVARANNFDTILINSSNKSYSEMLKVVRENINPENLGIQVKSIRKMKDDSLLLVTEKENVEKLKEEIRNNENINDVKIVEKKATLLISGMDEVTTKEEIITALNKKIGSDEATHLCIKTLYANRSGEQIATIETTRALAVKLLITPTIRIGWSNCRIKEKVIVLRCTNCLKVGHAAKYCRAKKSRDSKCLRCTQEGHNVKDCKNESYCLSCDRSGHRSDSMSCPKYRKLVHQKEAELTQC